MKLIKEDYAADYFMCVLVRIPFSLLLLFYINTAAISLHGEGFSVSMCPEPIYIGWYTADQGLVKCKRTRRTAILRTLSQGSKALSVL